MVRFSPIAQVFTCPAVTGLAFYFFAFLDFNEGSVATVFTIVVAINTVYFILVIFNEVWLISTVVYAPLLAQYMWKLGEGFAKNEENTELIVRCLFCTVIYATVAYSTEKANKTSFLGKHQNNLGAMKWMRMFEKFPDGVALVSQDDNIEYANQSLADLLDISSYDGGIADPLYMTLKKRLQET